jgi:hypothetical protein
MSRTYKPYVVQQGDHGARLAFRAGAPAAEVWDHPKNAELRKKRETMDVLLPGDVIHLPDGAPPGLPVNKETKNRFKATIGKRKTKVHLRDQDGPLANEPYEIRGLPMGSSGADGLVEIDVPTTATEVVIYLPARKHSLVIHVGGMDPSGEASGTLRRLENLGYLHVRGNVSEELLEAALRAFQRDQGLKVTGKDDDATRDKLREVART